MGTTADKLSYLNETKGMIKSALITKGVTITDDMPFRDYAALIEEIDSSANFDSLFAESDPDWLNTLASTTTQQKITYLEAWRDDILTAIAEKGIALNTPQPFRTISELIVQIQRGYMCDLYWGDYTDL